MWEELKLSPEDVIAVIAPHPDDECLGAASVLLTAPERTDVYVLTDGSHGSKERTIEEEAAIRKAQFDAEMACVKPRSVHWLGYEDTTLPKHYEAADSIDFTQYTKFFLPWQESVHPDHRAACVMCCRAIMKQNASPECYIYEITAPFKWPTHFADITQLIDEKCRLIDCHKDQIGQKEITVTLNALRAAILIRLPAVHYAECYMKVDPYEIGYCNDILVRLNSFKEDYGLYDRLLEQGIRIKRVMSCDIGPVQDFIRNNFAGGWADEVLPAILNGRRDRSAVHTGKERCLRPSFYCRSRIAVCTADAVSDRNQLPGVFSSGADDSSGFFADVCRRIFPGCRNQRSVLQCQKRNSVQQRPYDGAGNCTECCSV